MFRSPKPQHTVTLKRKTARETVPATLNGPRVIEPDTRTRILDAALDQFGARGFAATSIRDLAQAAGVNVAAVNYYFGSKDALRVEALRHGFAPTVAIAQRLQ